MGIRPGKDLVTPADMQAMRTKQTSGDDELRARAIVCVGKNLTGAEALEVMEMLGLIDGKGEYVAAGDLNSHTLNPRRRGIGNWT